MYQNGGQTNIQIPYEVAGSAMASVVLTQGTQTTAAFTLPVAATAPGVFTIDFSGTGQAVALNADGTVNSAPFRRRAGRASGSLLPVKESPLPHRPTG